MVGDCTCTLLAMYGGLVAHLGPQPPLARVDISAHDDSLDLGTESMITCHHLCCQHQCDTCVCVCLRVFLNSCLLRRVAGNLSIAH